MTRQGSYYPASPVSMLKSMIWTRPPVRPEVTRGRLPTRPAQYSIMRRRHHAHEDTGHDSDAEDRKQDWRYRMKLLIHAFIIFVKRIFDVENIY